MVHVPTGRPFAPQNPFPASIPHITTLCPQKQSPFPLQPLLTSNPPTFLDIGHVCLKSRSGGAHCSCLQGYQHTPAASLKYHTRRLSPLRTRQCHPTPWAAASIPRWTPPGPINGSLVLRLDSMASECPPSLTCALGNIGGMWK